MEFPTLGQQCTQEDCSQLDFLPFECAHCHLVFCNEHHMPSNHCCKSYKDNIVTKGDIEGIEKEKWQYKCSYPECHMKELVPIHCVKCKRHFCLSHRHCDQHECIKEVKSIPSVLTGLEAGKELQAKLKVEINAKLEEAKAAGGHKGIMANKLALMKLKGRAKGDNTIPRTERIFFTVDCPNRQQNPIPLDLFMGITWTMGKTVDFVAKQGSIKNKNHLPQGPFLHLFKGETCISKPFNKTIQQLISEELLVDGDSLSLRFV